MKKNKSILLVEDDSVDVMTLKRVFKKIRVKNPLHVCGNGEEALQWLEQNKADKPGLILLDLNMPRMNGLEFLKVVKKDEALKIIPIVVLTTSSDPMDRQESFKSNVAGYMLKSLNHEEYLQTIGFIRDYWKRSELAY